MLCIVDGGPKGCGAVFAGDRSVVARKSGTGFESRPGQMFVIVVGHLLCFKLFKGLECEMPSMVLCTVKNH